MKGRTEKVATLLDHGADIHAESDVALRCAAAYGHTDTTRLLLDRGADNRTACFVQWQAHCVATGIRRVQFVR